VETLIRDIRISTRMLLKSPAFTIAAVIALALGIGANTALFSVVNAVLMRPLPYPDPARLVIVWEKSGQEDSSVAYPNFLDLESRNQSLERLTAFRSDSLNLIGQGEPERLRVRMVSADFFSTFGVSLSRGRDFAREDDRQGTEPVCILSHALWNRRFGADETTVGRQITLSDRSFTVIGITQPDFQFGSGVDSGVDLFVPLGLWADRYQDRREHPGIGLVGRLKGGAAIEQARADLDSIMAVLSEHYPQSNAERRVHVASLYENTVQDVRPSLLILLGAVGLVLLIACANVANLLLARATSRQREMAVRIAIGAGRWRIIRQLLTESMLLAIAGGSLGVLLALWGTDLLIRSAPDVLPRLAEAGIDGTVLGFTIALSVLTGILFGVVPAWHASHPEISESLKEGGRGSTGPRAALRNALVVGEIAMSLMLLIGSGLLVRSFWIVYSQRPGFDPTNVLTMELSIPVKKGEQQKARNFMDELEDRIGNLPGVEAVAVSNGLPFQDAVVGACFVEGDTFGDPQSLKVAVLYITSGDYLKVMGIRLLRGRYFDANKARAGQPEVVIDQAFADKYLAGRDPIGARLVSPPGQPNPEIVGIVEHVKHYGLEGQVPVEPQLYRPIAAAPDEAVQFVAGRLHLIIRSSSDRRSMATAVRNEVVSLDKNQPVYNVTSMEASIGESIAARRFTMQLLIIFAMVALILASVGIYGVVSYSVTQRRREIGIRMALGARSRDVVRMMVFQGLKLTGAGVAFGLAGAFSVTRLGAALLYGVSATDTTTFVTVSVALTTVALIASYVPARRAAKVDPMTVLRSE
jgi:putative ABC transport system permease protein